MPDAETASILNPRGAAIGTVLPFTPPSLPVHLPGHSGPPATLQDANVKGLTFYVGGKFPALQYGELIADGESQYVIETEGKVSVPDAATLASLGYQASEAQAIADEFFQYIPGGLSYLPVAPTTSWVVRGSMKPTDIFLYEPAPGSGVQKTLIVGAQTLAYYEQQFKSLFVLQTLLDAVPFSSAGKTEKFLQKTVTISQIQCLKGAHRSGGDSVDVMYCKDKPGDYRQIYAAPSSAALQNYVTVCGIGIHESDPPKPVVPNPGDATNAPTFSGSISLALVVNADTYPVGGNDSIDTQGWLDCEGTYIDLTALPSGLQTLNFQAMTQAFDIGPFPTGSDWTVRYALTIKIDYALDSAGHYIPVSPALYPNNAYGVEHFFVLMMENRSFDHLLGANKKLTPSDGVRAQIGTPSAVPGQNTKPFAPDYTRTDVTGAATFDGGFQDALVAMDPGHEIDQVLGQIVGTSLVANDGYGGANPSQVMDASGNVIAPVPPTLDPAAFVDSFNAVFKKNCENSGIPYPPPPGSAPLLDSVLGCMDPTQGQAYAVNALAENFQTMDRWFSSVPGPTWPNRFFLHCGTSGGVSISPDNISGGVINYATGNGFKFDQGSIFDRLTALGVPWRVYHSGGAQVWGIQKMSPLWNYVEEAPLFAPLVALFLTGLEVAHLNPGVALYDFMTALTTFIADGVGVGLLIPGLDVLLGYEIFKEARWLWDNLQAVFGSGDATMGSGLQRDFDGNFQSDVSSPGYIPFYTFIEPRVTSSATLSTDANLVNGVGPIESGHPSYGLEKVSEDYIAKVYSYLRNTSMWNSGKCALILLYDEHGGIYDHVAPPQDLKYDPGEQQQIPGIIYRQMSDPSDGETYHLRFNFSLLGIRVPAVLISPYHYCGTGQAPRKNDGTVYDHASIIKTLQLRLGDTAYLTNRVSNVNDMFKTFGTTPFDPTAPGTVAPLQIPAPSAPDIVPPTGLSKQPIPAVSSPNLNFLLDRAAEILYRCNLSADPSTLAQIVATAKALPLGPGRAASVQASLAQLLQAEQARRASLKTIGDAELYLGSATIALEAYRKRLASSAAANVGLWSSTQPKQRYAALRAQMPAAVAQAGD